MVEEIIYCVTPCNDKSCEKHPFNAKEGVKHRFRNYPECNTPYKVEELMCLMCGYRWIDARPANVLLKDMDCPNCGSIGHIFCTGQDLSPGLLELFK